MPSERRRPRTLGLLPVLIACNVVMAGESRTIERIVAVVDDQPVFLSEARSLARLHAVDEKVAVEALIDELLMYREALRFPPAQAAPQEAESALESLTLGAAHAPDLAESDLRRMARRQATIMKYIALRLEPQIRVDPEEIRRLWEEEYGKSADAPPFDSVFEHFEGRLRKREMDGKVEAWVRTLRSEARIRRNETAGE
ncbi:MAG: hypothetical protein JXO72_05375 [Vicinamibacteria bacterium]|nr:hypothetical protein [Vicinamibacteria bacterium]